MLLILEIYPSAVFVCCEKSNPQHLDLDRLVSVVYVAGASEAFLWLGRSFFRSLNPINHFDRVSLPTLAIRVRMLACRN